MDEYFLYLILGLLVAFSSNFLGLGGGVIIGPVLISMMERDVHWSLGVTLGSAFLVTATNTYKFHKLGRVNWGVVAKVAAPAGLFAIMAASFAQEVPALYLQRLLGLVLLVLGIFLFLQKVMVGEGKGTFAYGNWVFISLGALSGTLSGFTGVGAGLIFMPLFLTARQVGNERAVACSNAAMVVSTSLGFIVYTYYQWHQVGDLARYFIPIAVISLVSWLGGRLFRHRNSRLADRVRVFMIFLILLFLGGHTLIKSFNLFAGGL